MSYGVWQDYADKHFRGWRREISFSNVETTLRTRIRKLFKGMHLEIPVDLREWSRPRLKRTYLDLSAARKIWCYDHPAWAEMVKAQNIENNAKDAAPSAVDKQLPLFGGQE